MKRNSEISNERTFLKRKEEEEENKNNIMKVLILKLRILISEGAGTKREQGKRQM